MPALVPAIPSARSRTSPAERPPPRPRSRTGTSSSTRPEPLVFPDWWAFERAVTALATSQGFQVGMCEIEVDADVLALGCTEPGCTWRVAVAQASGAERVVVYEQTCYEHRHEPPTRKRKAVEKASVGGSTKGKGLVKADKVRLRPRPSLRCFHEALTDSPAPAEEEKGRLVQGALAAAAAALPALRLLDAAQAQASSPQVDEVARHRGRPARRRRQGRLSLDRQERAR